MQVNDFEKNIKATMESFTIKPNDIVWTNVAQQIAQKEKRRKTILWFFSIAIICSAIGIFIYFENQKAETFSGSKRGVSEVHEKSVVENKNILSNDEAKQPSLTAPVDTNRNKDVVKGIAYPSSDNKLLNKMENKQVVAIERNTNGHKLNTVKKQATHPLIQPTSIINNEKNSTIADSYAQQNQKNNTKHLPLKDIDEGGENLNLSTVDTTVVSDIHSIKQNSTTQPNSKNEITPSIKKLKFGFTIFGGISNNIQSDNSENKFADENYIIPSGALNQGGTTTNLRFKSSLSLGVGGFMQKELSKKFDFSVGAEYHYFSTTSVVGQKISRATNPLDSLLIQDNSIDNYYKVGDVNTYNNRYHLLQFPLGVNYSLNNKSKNGIRLSGYVVPGFLIMSNALFENKSKMTFYKNNEQFNRFNLSCRLDVLWSFKNKRGKVMEVGPMLQYQINNMVNSSVNVPQHLFFTGIKTNFFLQ